MPVKSSPGMLGGGSTTTTTSSGTTTTTTTTAAEPVRREVDAGVDDPAIEWVHNAPASVFYGTSTSGSITWDYAPSSRPEMDEDDLKSNAAQTYYFDHFRIQKSDGECDLQLSGNRSGNTRRDLSNAWETGGEVEIVSGSRSITVAIAGADRQEDYSWTPSNAAEAITFAKRARYWQRAACCDDHDPSARSGDNARWRDAERCLGRLAVRRRHPLQRRRNA